MLDVSVDVESNDPKTALIEVNSKYNDYALVDCWLYVMDKNGTIHKLNIHDFKIDLYAFIN